mgnify:CR=1 FL=1
MLYPSLSRGHEVKRPQKLFSKKVEITLDTFDIVIYVTRITTERYAVFVSASACNPSFGQGYAHQLIGEIEMETDKIIEMFGLTLRTFGTKKGVKDLKPIRLMVTDDAMWKLKCASFSAHCSVGELCNAIVMQWLSEHESEIKKD